MGERKITLFEFHSHGTGPSLISNLGIGEEDEDPEDTAVNESEAEDESGGRNGLRILLVLAVLIAIGAAVRYYRSNGDEPATPVEPDEVAVTEYED